MQYAELKKRHRVERDAWHPNLNLRVHRALSWLDRAEQLGAQDDADSQFILLWIAFNAAYATEIDERFRLSEQETFRAFLSKLVQLDTQGRIAELVWTEFPKSIRVLLDNKFVFQDFWNFQNGSLPEEEWERRFADARKKAKAALGAHDTVSVLAIVLSRIYTLRNQLIHGGATWGGSVNREQMRDCVNLMGKLVRRLTTARVDERGSIDYRIVGLIWLYFIYHNIHYAYYMNSNMEPCTAMADPSREANCYMVLRMLQSAHEPHHFAT